MTDVHVHTCVRKHEPKESVPESVAKATASRLVKNKPVALLVLPDPGEKNEARVVERGPLCLGETQGDPKRIPD